MLDQFKGFWKLPDLRKKIFFTLAIIAIYRLGANVPVPGVNVNVISQVFAKAGGGILGLLNLFSGGAFERFAVFTLGIMPYITAAIIMELLRVVIPKIEQWHKEGELGQRKIIQWTRYLTLLLATVESIGFTFVFQGILTQAKVPGFPPGFSIFTKFLIVITLVTGTMLIMWLGELITQNGIGNGMSIIITVNILSRFPGTIIRLIQTNPVALAFAVIILIVMIVAVVYMEEGQRRIPVQYAKRVIGRKMYGGSSTYIPLKINSAGVIPIIFATSILAFPQTIARFFGGNFSNIINRYLAPQGAIYLGISALFIIFFTYFYTAIIFNPKDTADNLKKYGGFVPGVRPGQATAEYINHILTRMTLPGSIFLSLLYILPSVIFGLFTASAERNLLLGAFSGISILIVVGVSLETVRQLESQLVMRHYEGFLK